MDRDKPVLGVPYDPIVNAAFPTPIR